MKLHLPHLLRNALLAALLCCTMAFGTVTVTVGDQDSNLEKLTGSNGIEEYSFAEEGEGDLTVKKGEKIMSDDFPFISNLTIEEGGEFIAGDCVFCSSLNGKGTLRFAGSVEDWYDGEITIDGTGGLFEGNVEGFGWMDVTGGIWGSVEQTFSNVTARETVLETSLGDAILAGSKNEFQAIVLGDAYSIGYVAILPPPVPDITDTLSIEEGTKVTLDKYSVQPDDDPDPTDIWDPKIDAPFITGGRGLSFRMDDRSQLVMKYGKGETGAKITASGAINLSTTTWEGHDLTRLTVRVEFAENPGKDLKQLLIQANGIVLTSMGYSETGNYTTRFTLLKQYTDENSEADLNKWLKENVTVEVDDYEDPYLVVKKKEGRLV